MRTTLAIIETEKTLPEIYEVIKNEKDPIAGFIKRYHVENSGKAEFEFRRNQKGTSLNSFFLSKSQEGPSGIKIRVNHGDFKTHSRWSALVAFLFALIAGLFTLQPLAFALLLIPVVILLLLSNREPGATDKWIDKELKYIASLLNARMKSLTLKND